MQDPVAVDVRQLSSGTLGKLIGKADYASIDQAQAEFLAFVTERPGQFETWQDAWAAFRPEAWRYATDDPTAIEAKIAGEWAIWSTGPNVSEDRRLLSLLGCNECR